MNMQIADSKNITLTLNVKSVVDELIEEVFAESKVNCSYGELLRRIYDVMYDQSEDDNPFDKDFIIELSLLINDKSSDLYNNTYLLRVYNDLITPRKILPQKPRQLLVMICRRILIVVCKTIFEKIKKNEPVGEKGIVSRIQADLEEENKQKNLNDALVLFRTIINKPMEKPKEKSE